MNFKPLLFLYLFATSLVFGKGVDDAAGYHINSSLQMSSAKSVIQSIPWKGDERVLDVGCGDGKVTAWIAENFSKGLVIGTDISDSMIQFASSRYSKELYPNLEFSKADAAALAFDEQFDIVVSFSTLHWVLDQEAALQSIFKALVPGGRAYILTYGKNRMNLAKLAENLIYSEKWSPYFPDYTPQRVYYTPEAYVGLLKNAGFSDIELTAESGQTSYADRKALTAFVAPLLNFINHLPQELKGQFVDEVVDQIVALSTPTEDGSIIFDVLNLYASVLKPELRDDL